MATPDKPYRPDVLASLKRDFRGWQFWVVVATIFVAPAICRPTVALFLWLSMRLGNTVLPLIFALGGVLALIAEFWFAVRRQRYLRARRLAGEPTGRPPWLLVAGLMWLIMLGAHGGVALAVWQAEDGDHRMIQSGIDYQMQKFLSGNLGW